MKKPTAQEVWERIHKDIHVLCGYCNDDGWVQHELEELIKEYCDAYHEEQRKEHCKDCMCKDRPMYSINCANQQPQ